MSKLIYSYMTLSVCAEVDFVGDGPRSEMVVRGMDTGISSCRGGRGTAEVARSNAHVLLLILIGEGDCGGSVGEGGKADDTIP